MRHSLECPPIIILDALGLVAAIAFAIGIGGWSALIAEAWQ